SKEDREGQSKDQFKIFLRQPDHPTLRGLASVTEVLRYLMIDQYYATQARFQWANNDVEELATLPSRKELRDFEDNAKELYKKVEVLADDEKNAKYRPGLLRHHDDIRKVLGGGGKYPYELAVALDGLLLDR